MSDHAADNPSEPPPGESRFKLTADDIRKVDWQTCLANHPVKECWSFFEALLKGARELEAKGDKIGNRVYSLLSIVASFHPNYDAAGNPYGPMWSGFNGRRAIEADDLTAEDLQALEGTVSEIKDPEMRARVADVLWVRDKNFKAAQLAVPAYLESAQRLKTVDGGPRFTEKLERAAQISARKGFESLEKTVVTAIEDYITEYSGDLKGGLLCYKLMSILVKIDGGDAKQHAILAEKLANEFAKENNWHFSELYWKVTEQWHRRLKDEAAMMRCRLAAAESYVSRSEAGLANGQPNYGYRAHWMGKGLESLRQAKAAPARVTEIHLRFLELEKLALSEMRQIAIDPAKIPGMQEDEEKAQAQAAAFVSGLPWEEALTRFLNIATATNVQEFRQQVEKQSEQTIFDKIITTTAVDRFGKVTDSMDPTIGEANEDVLRKQMVHQARTINWPLRVAWTIEPARRRLFMEHSVRVADLRFFVDANPLVPPQHEGIYLRGFQAGFFGDWLTAMHLLVPQVEASIRHVFQQHDVITSTLDAEGIQQEKDLNTLLWLPQMEEIFGPDITFDLRGILIERFGHNLRNESAHGLMPEYAFYQEGSVYLWWLLMHLCWRGYRMAQLQSAPAPPAADSPPPPATTETPPSAEDSDRKPE